MTIVNITVYNDADFTRGFLYQDTTGAPIDLTGADLFMRMRSNVESATVEMELSTDDGSIIVDNASSGAFHITIPQSELERLTATVYQQSLILERGAAKQQVWHGTFTNMLGPSR
jgi:hypothetical protein